MKRSILLIPLVLFATHLWAPPNCEIYKDDKSCYKACEEAMTAIRYRQGSWQSQQHFDKSLEWCPEFAYSYMEKAVPFLKRGDFITWKKLIDKAVEYSPSEYLGYRGWCRLQFLRDYDGAIQDIEELKEIYPYDIGYCQTGDYHLMIALALCYKALGDHEKALMIIEKKLEEDNYHLGLYDYYHLGIIHYELGDFEKAIQSFQRQIEENDYIGETYYYLALANEKLGNREACLDNLNKAKTYYESGNMMTDTYTEPIGKIFLSDIEEALASMQSN